MSARPPTVADVFVSHASRDAHVAKALCHRLEEDGVRCWVAPRDIVPGASWGEAILTAISSARVMVIVLSEGANLSRHVLREVERAIEKDRITIPFRVQDVAPNPSLEYFLSSQHWMDAITPPLEAHLGNLSRTIRSILSSEAPAPSPAAEPTGADKRLVAEFDEFAPDDWGRRPKRSFLRFLSSLLEDK